MHAKMTTAVGLLAAATIAGPMAAGAGAAQDGGGAAGSTGYGKATKGIPSAGVGYVAPTKDGQASFVRSIDGRQIVSGQVSYVAHCDDGTEFTEYRVFEAIPIAAARTFKATYDSGQQASPMLPGATVRATGMLAGKLNKLRTRIVGTARFTVAITIAGSATTVTCDSGLISFVAKD